MLKKHTDARAESGFRTGERPLKTGDEPWALCGTLSPVTRFSDSKLHGLFVLYFQIINIILQKQKYALLQADDNFFFLDELIQPFEISRLTLTFYYGNYQTRTKVRRKVQCSPLYLIIWLQQLLLTFCPFIFVSLISPYHLLFLLVYFKANPRHCIFSL